jgi:hypothetical protein
MLKLAHFVILYREEDEAPLRRHEERFIFCGPVRLWDTTQVAKGAHGLQELWSQMTHQCY